MCSEKHATSAKNEWLFTLKIHGPDGDNFYQHPNFAQFNRKACDLRKHGDSDLRYKADPHANEVDYDPCYPPATPTIKTDKVTKSEAANGAAGGGSIANDPNVTIRVMSNSKDDVKAVLDTFP